MKRLAGASGAGTAVVEPTMAFSAIAIDASQEAPARARPARSRTGGAASAKPMRRVASTSVRPRTGRILVVNTKTHERLQLEAMLLAHGYTVVSASGFEQANDLLEAIPVDLLVTALHLASFNGLHLAVRSRWSDSRRMVIVTHDTYDASVKELAESVGARYIVDPMENPEFFASVEQALHGGHFTELTA
jgi:PleD family two-component response regulator